MKRLKAKGPTLCFGAIFITPNTIVDFLGLHAVNSSGPSPIHNLAHMEALDLLVD